MGDCLLLQNQHFQLLYLVGLLNYYLFCLYLALMEDPLNLVVDVLLGLLGVRLTHILSVRVTDPTN